MTLEYVLRQRGIEPQRDAVVDTSVQFNMMAGAFTGGNGDYVTLFEPTATEVEQAGKGYILCSIGQESGEIPYTAYFANRSYVEANPETVQGFVNAMAFTSSGWRSTRTARWRRPSVTSSRTRTWTFWSGYAPGTGKSTPGTAPR